MRLAPVNAPPGGIQRLRKWVADKLESSPTISSKSMGLLGGLGCQCTDLYTGNGYLKEDSTMNEPKTATDVRPTAADIGGMQAEVSVSGVERGHAKVLIVDDTPANSDLLRDMLQPLGAQIFFATSGAMALDIATNAQPDLILLDIMMPDMDGLETCRQLKANKALATIPVIFVTAKTDVEDLVNGFAAGGVDYITKPVKQPEVHARVNAHLPIQGLIRRQSATLSALEIARKDLQELNATKDKFLSSVGRTLRDSLQEISAASQAIKDWAGKDQPDQPDIEQRLEDVNRSAETVLGLLEKILEWPRVQAGQKLDLLDMEITDRDLAYLVEALDNLKFLSLAGTRITDAGLAHVKSLQGLQELHLDRTAITNDGLAMINGLQNLEVLDLKDTRIDDTGLATLASLRNLRGLYLTRTRITDTGLAQIGMLTELRTLILWDTQVTDKGLRHLRSLRNLQELILWKTGVSEQGAAELRKTLPGCDVSTSMFS